MHQPAPLFSSIKITQPVLTQYIERERLFELLDGHTCKPVVWIVGPGGSGKTTLISSYIERKQLPVIWYQADEGDGDAATFFHYLAQAAGKANPRKKTAFPVLTPVYQQGLHTYSRRFFEQVFGQTKKNAVLVIDNYQDIPADSSVHELILAGMDAVPKHFTVIFLSRHTPPEQYSRMQANQQLGIIDWQDLSLQQDEAQAIISQKVQNGQELPTDFYMRIHGWVAGLVLFLEWVRQEDDILVDFDDFLPESIFNYFASEILKRTDMETREILIQSSLLPTMSAQLVTQLTGNRKSRNILRQLARKSYFVTKHPGRQVTYQYHPLFREFLLYQAEEEYSDDELSNLLRRAGSALEVDGQIEAAIESYLKAKDYETLISLLYKCGDEMIDTGRAQTLQQWIRAVPENLRVQHPLLILWHSICVFAQDVNAAERLGEQAFHLFREADNVAGIYRSLVATIYALISTWDAIGEKLDKWLELFDQIKTRHPLFPSVDAEADVATVLVTAFLWRRPDHPDTDWWRKRAEDLLPVTVSEGSRFANSTILGYMDLMFGDPEKAMLKLKMVEPLLDYSDLPPFHRTFTMVALSYLSVFMGNSERCCKLAEAVIGIGEQTGVRINEYHAQGHAFQSLLLTGQLEKARQYYEYSSQQYLHMPLAMQAYHHWLSSFYLFLIGDFHSAKEYGEIAVARSDDSGVIMYMSLARIGLAEALFELNEEVRAWSVLNEGLQIASRGHKLFQYWAMLVEAYYAGRSSDKESALKKLRDAFAFGRVHGYARYYLWRQDALSELCVTALEHQIETDYVQKAICARALIPSEPPHHLPNWPWRIRIHTFGEFRVFVESEQIGIGRKFPKKPFNLLKVIISLGGAGIHESRLFDALWPDEDADSAAVSLKVALHRLRKLLGNESITLQDGRYGIDQRHCWVDAWAFDRILNQSKRMPGNEATLAAMQQIEFALDLHHGVFLAGDLDQPWALVMREHYRTRFINQIESLGSRLEANGDINQALGWYRKGLEVDALAEPFYQGLMRCYINQDQYSNAVKVYRRCQQILTTSLDVEPSRLTKEIYRQISG